MTAPTEDDLDHVGLRDQVRAAQQEIDQLRQGLQAHAVIDQARGILMAVHGVAAEEAWQLLTRVSAQTNTRVRRLAQALTAMVSGRPAEDVQAAEVVVDRLLRPAAGDRVAAEFVARLIRR